MVSFDPYSAPPPCPIGPGGLMTNVRSPAVPVAAPRTEPASLIVSQFPALKQFQKYGEARGGAASIAPAGTYEDDILDDILD